MGGAFSRAAKPTCRRDPPDIMPAESDLPIDCGAPTKEEIRNAIKPMRNSKSPGPESIPAEAHWSCFRTSGKRSKCRQ